MSDGTWLLAENKSLYNKLYYRGKQCAGLWEKWESLAGMASKEEQRRWVDDVVKYKAHVIPPRLVMEKHIIESSNSKSKESGWINFKAAADLDGETAVREMIAFGSVKTRRHPQLPPDSTLEWPHDQQVFYVTEKATSTEAEKDISEAQGDEPMDEEKFDARRRATKAEVAHVAPPAATKARQAAPPPAAQQTQPTDHARDKECIAALRKAHSQWDRTKKDWMALLVKARRALRHAAANPNRTCAR